MILVTWNPFRSLAAKLDPAQVSPNILSLSLLLPTHSQSRQSPERHQITIPLCWDPVMRLRYIWIYHSWYANDMDPQNWYGTISQHPDISSLFFFRYAEFGEVTSTWSTEPGFGHGYRGFKVKSPQSHPKSIPKTTSHNCHNLAITCHDCHDMSWHVMTVRSEDFWKPPMEPWSHSMSFVQIVQCGEWLPRVQLVRSAVLFFRKQVACSSWSQDQTSGQALLRGNCTMGLGGATGKTRTKTIMPSLHELRLPNLPSFRISVRSCCMLLSSTPSRAMDKSSQIISASRPCLPQSTQPVGTAPLALRAPPSLPVEMPHTTPKRTAMHCDTRMRHCKAKRHPGIPGAAQHKCRLSKAQWVTRVEFKVSVISESFCIILYLISSLTSGIGSSFTSAFASSLTSAFSSFTSGFLSASKASKSLLRWSDTLRNKWRVFLGCPIGET